jgi:hypothetical protein
LVTLVAALMLALAAPSDSSERGSISARPALARFHLRSPARRELDRGDAQRYYGGLQMDVDFERSYGSKFVSTWGHANRWPSAVQITVAMRAYVSRGFAPWPKTAKFCGLL